MSFSPGKSLPSGNWLAFIFKKVRLLLLLIEQTLPVLPITHFVPRGKRYMCDGATAVPSSSSLHMFPLNPTSLSRFKMNVKSSHSSRKDCTHIELGTVLQSNSRIGFESSSDSLPFDCDSLAIGRFVRAGGILLIACLTGCNFIPDIKHKPQYHNPFPQISKVAVLPFRNQSQEPTLSGARVSQAYYNELQSIRGFEVVPFGVVENQLAQFETQVLRRPITTPVDFQQFAKHLGVDAVLQGAITDYDAYYPPRIALKVNWYAANPGFHPIPVGYGLPWGTKKEKKIPEWIRLESERELAAEQMKTQTPVETDLSVPVSKEKLPESKKPESKSSQKGADGRFAATRIELPVYSTNDDNQDKASSVLQASALQEPARMPESIIGSAIREPKVDPLEQSNDDRVEPLKELEDPGMPANWPDPQGFIPRQPTAKTPEMKGQYEPIISHMRSYNGNDEDFTHALGEYFYFRDDARFGGWQAYLQRSEDFIRFCCHQHVVETLESRGGSLESRMILRWPVGRYER